MFSLKFRLGASQSNMNWIKKLESSLSIGFLYVDAVSRQLWLRPVYFVRQRRSLRCDYRQYTRDRYWRDDELQGRRRPAHARRGRLGQKIVAAPAPRLTKRYQNIETYTNLPEITLRQF